MKRKRRSSYFLLSSILADTLIINVAFVITFYLQKESEEVFFSNNQTILFWLFNAIWFLLLLIRKPYREPRISFNISKLLYNFYLLLLIHASLIAIIWVISNGIFSTKISLTLTYLLAAVLGSLLRIVGVIFLRYLRRKGFNVRNYVVVGYGELSPLIVNYYNQHPEMGYVFKGYLGDSNYFDEDFFINLEKNISEDDLHYIYCCMPYLENKTLEKITNLCKHYNVSIKVLMDYRSFAKNGLSVEYHGPLPIINVSSNPYTDQQALLVKRAFDLIFSSSIMILGAPLFLIFAIVTKLTSPGPVFYKSERVGLWGKKFMMYKFRSMTNEASLSKKIVLTEGNDMRVTKWGKIMRKTRIDEIPQFLNVLKGEMSIVGPRPGIPSYNDAVLKLAPEFQRLLAIKPGVTSFGQINYGYAETPEEMVKRMRYDLLHLNNNSLKTDIWLVILTAKIMVQGKGQ
ncbi:MAG: sugar transferase [Cytophagales bacterium]|nr:sugar transferase [Cytophagales bacterium]